MFLKISSVQFRQQLSPVSAAKRKQNVLSREFLNPIFEIKPDNEKKTFNGNKLYFLSYFKYYV